MKNIVTRCSNNNISRSSLACDKLITLIHYYPLIKILNLSDNPLDALFIEKFSFSLTINNTLEELDLSNTMKNNDVYIISILINIVIFVAIRFLFTKFQFFRRLCGSRSGRRRVA